jgi:hypothetical protein
MQRPLQRGTKRPAGGDWSASESISRTSSSRKTFPSGIKLLHDAEDSVVE